MHNLFWALLVIFLFGALLQMDWIYYLAYVVGGVYLYSHWSVRRSLKHLEVRRKFLDKAFVGQTIPVRLTLTNGSRLPAPWVLVQERMPLELRDLADYRLVVNMGGRATVEHTYPLQAKQRGYFMLGPISLRSGDLFGFTEVTWQETNPPHVTVYPRVLPLQRLGLPSRIPFGALPSPQRIFEDPARLSGVRAYVPGDSQRRIHWKASAHTDTLLVKKLAPAIGLNVMVVLDMNRASYRGRYVVSTSEWAVSVAASIANAVVEQRQPVGLLCNGRDAAGGAAGAALPTRAGQGHLITVLEALARTQLSDEGPELAAWLPGPLAALEWGTNIVLVAPQLEERVLWLLHQAYRRGSSVTVLLCAGQPDLRGKQARARKLGVALYEAVWDRDLQAIG